MFLFLDLETTGLDPQKDEILEVAWLPTDSSIQTWFGTHTESTLITPTQATFDKIASNHFVSSMHEESGLFMDLKDAEMETGLSLKLEDAEDQILDTIKTHSNGDSWFLAGASVHFDLAFITNYMPRLRAKLEHRVHDTSTLKSLFAPNGVDLYNGYQNTNAHRAANDVDETVHLARTAYRWVERAKAVSDLIRTDTF